MPPLIILAGPTASGKSETAVALAEQLGSEIISADSMQVYRHFDIGTAKPPAELRARVPHHLIDILEPDEEFTAHDFKSRAEAVIQTLHRRQQVPILAGGTGLYLQVLIRDMECAIAVDPALRDDLREQMRRLGPQTLHAQLQRVDPVTAARVRATDPARIERALGVYRQTGTPLSEFHRADAASGSPHEVHMFVLEMDRPRLYAAVNRRVESMLAAGWLDEVRRLRARGYDDQAKPFQGIGYAQLLKHLRGELPYADAVHEIKRETRHYAKRQITWFKKQPGTQTVQVAPEDTPASVKDKILSRLPQGVAALALLLGLLMPPAAASAAGISLEQAGQWIQTGRAQAACTQLTAVRRAQPESDTAQRSDYLLGQCRAAQKQVAEAIRHFQAALQSWPELEDYIRLELSRAQLETGHPQAALEEATTLLQRFPQTRLGPEAELARAAALEALGQADRALFFLEEAEVRWTQKSPEPDFAPLVPELIRQQARLQEAKGVFSRAYLNYRKLYVRHPNHESAAEAEATMRRLVKAHAFDAIPLMEHEMNERTARLLEAARYQEALDTLLGFQKAFPKYPLPVQWYFDLATAYNGLRQRPRVVETLRTFLKKYPLDPLVQEARFRIGRTLWNLGRNEAALNYFQLILKTTLKPSWKIRAHFFLARVYENTGRPEQALEHYRALLEIGGNHLYVEKAAWRLAWIAIKDRRWTDALDRLKKNTRQRPEGILAAKNLFWSAKLYEKTGLKQKALTTYARLLETFPYSYYGVRAEQRLEALKRDLPPGTQPRVVKTGFVPPEEGPESLGRPLTEQERFHHVRALALSELGLYEPARREARQAAATVRKNLSGVLWASDLFLKTRAYPEALRVLYLYRDYKRAAGEKDLPVSFWKNFFPRAYAPLVEEPAQNLGLDPFFVNGLIRQESLFDTRVVSPAGARGLMQIMPETGRRLFTPGENHSRYDPDALFDPEVNIRLGVKYLSQLAQKYGKQDVYLLISYNAGPQVLENWLERFQDIQDEDLFIESLPYPETRGYVQRVLRNIGIYRRLYGAPAAPASGKTL